MEIEPKKITVAIDLGEAVYINKFLGRKQEKETLVQWISKEHHKLIYISGVGGIGKSTLATVIVDEVSSEFEYIFWRDLRNAPRPNDVLSDLLSFLNKSKNKPFTITSLIDSITNHKCLIVLDNIETILQLGTSAGYLRDNYKGYEALFNLFLNIEHNSCLLLTGRELPAVIKEHKNSNAVPFLKMDRLDIETEKGILIEKNIKSPFEQTEMVNELYEGDNDARFLILGGLDTESVRELLIENDVKASLEQTEMLNKLYEGNPLAIKISIATIVDWFNGAVDKFLEEYSGEVQPFDNIESLLEQQIRILPDLVELQEQQFNRLSSLERQILSVIALNNGNIESNILLSNLQYIAETPQISEALESLQLKSLIKNENSKITIPNLIVEYIRSQLPKLLSNVKSSLDTKEYSMTVFLIYAREDIELVNAYYQKLFKTGLKPWMDIYDLLPGQNWKTSIKRAIRESDFILIFLSMNSVTKQGYVQKEIREALEISQQKLGDDIFLIPVRVDDCPVPESFEDLQWLNLFDNNSWEKLIQAINVGFEKRKTRNKRN